jgi:hypothetical protein
MRHLLAFTFVIFMLTSHAQEVPSADWQIKTAIQAAPESFREEATVLGYDNDGQLITLREGTNSMICLADNPMQSGFSVSAYHQELEPFMERGRQLKAEGMGFKEIFDTREAEVKAGKLKMPEKTTLFVLSGEPDTETAIIKNPYLRYVIYIPYATSETTGLPTEAPAPGGPWIMDPGTHRAHIMIVPPKD